MTTTATETTRTLKIERADTIKTKRQRWAWDGRIPLGVVTLFAGRGGEGKSTFALHTIAQIGKGSLPGDLHGKPSPAIIISHEDDWSTQMLPRLIGNDADVSQVYKIGVTMTTDSVTSETVPSLPFDIGMIRAAIEQTGARVIVIDPITSTISGDLHKVETVRQALNPLAAIAAEYDIAIIGIMHFNKSAGNVSDKVSGSHAFRDTARSLLLFATDTESGKRVISFDKSNYSAERGSSLEFELESVTVPTDDGSHTDVAKVANLALSDISVSDIVNRPEEDSSDDRNDAERWLVGYLEDHGGSAPAGDIRKAALGDGFEWRTIQKWSRKVVEKRKNGYQGAWVWTLDLAKGAPKDSKGARPQEACTFGTFEDDGALDAPSGRHLHAVEDWDDPGCCAHGVTIGGRCRQCEGGIAA